MNPVLEYLHFLKVDCGYRDIKLFSAERWGAVMPLIHHAAIVTGTVGNRHGLDDRWCYRSQEDAARHLGSWDGVGEPDGWDRHHRTGRRREGGDPELETIRW